MEVAKKRKLSDDLLISTCLLSQSGLPLSFVSANAKVSKFASIKSAILFKIEKRCSAEVLLQLSKAFFAAFTATSMSLALLFGI